MDYYNLSIFIMKIIIGLGNPGSQYAQTRHNAGALFLQWLATSKFKSKSTAHTARYTLHTINDNLGLCIPTTFMNESGKALHALRRTHTTLSHADLLVVHDDLQHKLGNVRVKDGGSAQGHNGVQSLIRQLKTNSFKRLQLGIARPESRDPDIVAKYVLSNFTKSQATIFKESFQKAFQMCKVHNFL